MSDKSYKIQSVVDKTGVNPVTLRSWETRYGLLTPKRTDKGHRLYGMADVERIFQILNCLQDGIPISKVKAIIEPTPNPVVASNNPWLNTINELKMAIYRFDTKQLDKLYSEILSLHSVDVMLYNVLLPLLRELGERWEKRASGIAEEHFFSIFLRNKIGARYSNLMTQVSGPRVILACVPGEMHEIGLLLFGLFIIPKGIEPIIVGANMPLGQLAPMVTAAGANAVLLYGNADSTLAEDINRCAFELSVPILHVSKKPTVSKGNKFYHATTDFQVAAVQLLYIIKSHKK